MKALTHVSIIDIFGAIGIRSVRFDNNGEMHIINKDGNLPVRYVTRDNGASYRRHLREKLLNHA